MTSSVLILAILIHSVSYFCNHQKGISSAGTLGALDLQSFRVNRSNFYR